MPRRVLLIQLPIPPFGIEPIRGNVPLAAAYLKMYAEQHGNISDWQIDILDPRVCNLASDRALVERILAADAELLGFTCYLWNIQRTLWIAREIKRRAPHLKIILGGPEITLDNAWVLSDPAVDYAAIGEGEQTFAELLAELNQHSTPSRMIPGLYVAPPISDAVYRDLPTTGLDLFWGVQQQLRRPLGELPFPRQPLPQLDPISSPYLCGILDAADERLLLLETIRGCIYKCKFCYYPKSYDDLYFVNQDKILANLAHARERGAEEVVLLDPTLNQRARFNDFVQVLGTANPGHKFRYFGEIRSEGIMRDTVQYLAQANFTDIEIGLQSLDPLTMDLMDRNNNLRSFERAAGAMLEAGIRVQVDLIIGLPGDTMDSVRRGLKYLHETGLYTSVQVFNLAILPGTAFRHEATTLGLEFQDRPPYYVLKTPTLNLGQMYELMAEAQELFQTEYDPLATAVISRTELDWSDQPPIPATLPEQLGLVGEIVIDLKQADPLQQLAQTPAELRTQALNLRLQGEQFGNAALKIVEQVLLDNPHSTLQITLEPSNTLSSITPAFCEELERVGYAQPSYLDRFYSVLPGPIKGAKRLVIAVPEQETPTVAQLDELSPYGTIVETITTKTDNP